MSTVLTSRDGAVLTITLNRPEVYNAFNAELHAALHGALGQAADEAVRAVVITGAGKAFSAGQDLKEFQEDAGSVSATLEERYHPNVRRIRGLEKPVIASVNGVAAGAGLSLACVCDIRIASTAASFVPGFVGVGLVPDAGSTWFLERHLGYARALEWMCSNRRLSADDALVWGLVSAVLPEDGFEAAVAETAERWAAAPTRAVAFTKRLLELAHDAPLEEQLAREAEHQQAATETEDFREGVAAFLEKRAPRFSGR